MAFVVNIYVIWPKEGVGVTYISLKVASKYFLFNVIMYLLEACKWKLVESHVKLWTLLNFLKL